MQERGILRCAVFVYYISISYQPLLLIIWFRRQAKQGLADGRYLVPKDTCSIRESRGKLLAMVKIH